MICTAPGRGWRRVARTLTLPVLLAGPLIGGDDRAAAEGAPSGQFLAGVPLASLSATRDRPLFAPSRRVARVAPPPPPPLPPPAPAKPPPVAEPPQLTLLGIVRSPDGIGTTVLMDDSVRTSYSLRVGDDRRGWVVRSIDAEGVTIAKGEQTVRLVFLKGPKLSVGSPAD